MGILISQDKVNDFVHKWANGEEDAPEMTIMANGNLHDEAKATEVMNSGANFIAPGRGALANHDWPIRVEQGLPLQPFDSAILRPIANIKECELP